VDRLKVLGLVMEDGRHLANAAPKLRADRRVVLSAVLQCSQAIHFASDDLRCDPQILLAAGADRASLLAAGGSKAQILPRLVPATAPVGGTTSLEMTTWPGKARCERVTIQVVGPAEIIPTKGGSSYSGSVNGGVGSPGGAYFYSIRRQPGDVWQLLEPIQDSRLTGYATHRVSPPAVSQFFQRAVPAQSEYIILEFDGGHLCLCLDRSEDTLELMLGEGEAFRSYASTFTAAGRERPGASGKGELAVGLLGPAAGLPDLTASDVMAWLLGPMAIAWSSCPDFSAELFAFVTGERCKGLSELFADVAFVAQVVQSQGLALRFAAEPLKDDPHIVGLAVQQNGLAIQHASAALRAHADMAGLAVRQDARAWRYASKPLRATRVLAMTQDARGYTPLACEASAGDVLLVGELLAAKALVDREAQETGRTELIAAAVAGHGAIVALLLQARASACRADHIGDTALGWCVRHGLEDAIALLLDSKADPKVANKEGKTALSFVAETGQAAASQGVVGRLLAQKANVDHAGPGGCTPLMSAAFRGDAGLVARLLLAGAKVEQVDMEGSTALLYAARSGHESVVERLIRAPSGGVEINALDVEEMTALIWAARNGHQQVVSKLLKARAEVNHEGHRGFSALSWASQNGYSSVMTELLAARADVTHVDHEGNTPLILAAMSGHASVSRQLLARAPAVIGGAHALYAQQALQLAKDGDVVEQLQQALGSRSSSRQRQVVPAALGTAQCGPSTRRLEARRARRLEAL